MGIGQTAIPVDEQRNQLFTMTFPVPLSAGVTEILLPPIPRSAALVAGSVHYGGNNGAALTGMLAKAAVGTALAAATPITDALDFNTTVEVAQHFTPVETDNWVDRNERLVLKLSAGLAVSSSLSLVSVPLPANGWTVGTGTTLNVSSTPALAAVDVEWNAIRWAFDATTGITAERQIRLPSDFLAITAGGAGQLKLRVRAQKVDGSADENADLCLEVQIVWRAEGDTADKTLTTPVRSAALPAAVAAADWDTFTNLEFDIGAQILAEGKTLNPGDYLMFKLRPHETVGTTDMYLYAFAHEYVYASGKGDITSLSSVQMSLLFDPQRA